MQINPYSPDKLLLHYDKWQQISQWVNEMRDGGKSSIKLPAPITVSIDPSATCQMRCIGCNAHKVIESNKTKLDLQWVQKLTSKMYNWGVRGACCGGGGESSTNPEINQIIKCIHESGIAVGIVTNGLTIESLPIEYLKWIGISVDAGSSNTWCKVHGIKNKDLFYKMIGGAKSLSAKGADITYKYLVRKENVNEVLEGISIAAQNGFSAFHLRPMAYPWFKRSSEPLFTQTDMDKVADQLKSGRASFPKFPIFGVFDKVGANWEISHPFKKCWAIFATCVFQSNKKVGLCCDLRGNKLVEVGPFENPEEFINEFWGSKEHFSLQDKIDVNKCGKCTFSCLNKLFEEGVIKDGFYKDFI